MKEFSSNLNKLGIELIATGGTKKFLSNLGLKVTNVSDLTQFPEIMDGRLKILHPKILGGILAKLNKVSNIDELNKHNIVSIDMVIVNFYPFENTLKKELNKEELIENIDI